MKLRTACTGARACTASARLRSAAHKDKATTASSSTSASACPCLKFSDVFADTHFFCRHGNAKFTRAPPVASGLLPVAGEDVRSSKEFIGSAAALRDDARTIERASPRTSSRFHGVVSRSRGCLRHYSSSAIVVWLLAAAWSRGVLPQRSFLVTAAPAPAPSRSARRRPSAKMNRTTNAWPSAAATCNAVRPL
jgi:hypothetical protein